MRFFYGISASILSYLRHWQRSIGAGGIILGLLVGCTAMPQVDQEVTSGLAATVSPSLPMPTDVVTETRHLNPDWETDWLRREPCAPPCFAGIVPGSTMLSEAVDLLEQNPNIAYVTVYSDTAAISFGTVEWGWRTIFGGGTAIFTPTVDRITHVGVNITPIRLETLVTAYGDPSDVLALRIQPPPSMDQSITYSLWIVYRHLGLIMPVSGRAITPDTMLDSPRFFEATPQGLAGELHEREIQSLVPWAGYQPLAFYCRDASTGLLCEP